MGVKSAPLAPAPSAAPAADRATSLPPRGLPILAAAAYSGVPARTLWRLIASGQLAPVRVPGCRRTLVLRDDLDRLLEGARGSV